MRVPPDQSGTSCDASRSAVGTGLGLLIAKEIVEGHGGRIEVESSGVAGDGTTFTVRVPIPPSATIGAAAGQEGRL